MERSKGYRTHTNDAGARRKNEKKALVETGPFLIAGIDGSYDRWGSTSANMESSRDILLRESVMSM